MSQNTVTLNGTIYHRETGLPIGKAEPRTRQAAHSAHDMHRHTQRSRTLKRQYVAARPQPAPTKAKAPAARPIAVHHDTRSPKITKFAKRTPATAPAQKAAFADIAPTAHPMMQRVTSAQKSPVTKSAKPSDVIKREAIDAAMHKASPNHRRHRAPKAKPSLFRRFATMASAGAALILIGGYFTYLNMPNLSVRVAAAQAGINASYPNYRPSGYSISGPVAYDQGQVSMKFAANGGPQHFTLSQTKSGWDSGAVLSNYVQPKAGENYTTSRDSGLTIYTFDDSAAWVSGGILYTISGDAPLSPDQVRRIATSM